MTKFAYDHIAAKRKRPWKNEEEVRLAWVAGLESAMGIHFDAERAKKDSSYNKVSLPFKTPGFFKGATGSTQYTKAIHKIFCP